MATTEAAPATELRVRPHAAGAVRGAPGHEGDRRHLHPDPGPGRGGELPPVRPRPVQHALRLRRGRGPDLDQRRPRQARDPRAHDPRGRGHHPRHAEAREGRLGGRAGALRRRVAGGPGPRPRRHPDRGRDRPRPHPAGALPRAPAPGALRARGAALRRADPAGHALPEGAARVAQPLRRRGGRDRGPGHDGVAGLGGGRDQDGPALPLRPAERHVLHLRPRGDDPLRRPGPRSSGARPGRASSSPWSGT